MLKQQGKRPLLVRLRRLPPRRHRPAEGGGRDRLGVPVFEMGHTATRWRSPKRPCAHAKDHGNDYVIIDTAGRLHIDEAADG